MPNNNYRRGRAFEYKVKKAYEGWGCFVVRAAGSKGPADLVVLPPCGAPKLVQAKLGKMGKAENKRLARLARSLNCVGLVARPGKLGKIEFELCRP